MIVNVTLERVCSFNKSLATLKTLYVNASFYLSKASHDAYTFYYDFFTALNSMINIFSVKIESILVASA